QNRAPRPQRADKDRALENPPSPLWVICRLTPESFDFRRCCAGPAALGCPCAVNGPGGAGRLSAELPLGAHRTEHHHRRRLIIREQRPPAIRAEFARPAALRALEHPFDIDPISHGQDATRRLRGCPVALSARVAWVR